MAWLGATPKPGVFLHSACFGLATLPAGLAVTGESKGTPGRKPVASAVLGGMKGQG